MRAHCRNLHCFLALCTAGLLRSAWSRAGRFATSKSSTWAKTGALAPASCLLASPHLNPQAHTHTTPPLFPPCVCVSVLGGGEGLNRSFGPVFVRSCAVHHSFFARGPWPLEADLSLTHPPTHPTFFFTHQNTPVQVCHQQERRTVQQHCPAHQAENDGETHYHAERDRGKDGRRIAAAGRTLDQPLAAIKALV